MIPRQKYYPLTPVIALVFALFAGDIAAHLFADDRRPFMIGLSLGTLTAILPWHPVRVLGLIPYAASVLLLASIFGISTGGIQVDWLEAVMGAMIGIALLSAIRGLRPPEKRGESIALVIVVVLAMIGFATFDRVPPDRHGELLAIVAGGLALYSWYRLIRPAIELSVVPLLRIMYRLRGVGAGLKQFPSRGPCLVIANHACWVDPFFLGMLVRRPITPIMTSRFYDLPVAHFLLKHVIHAIRVPEAALKQDIPQEIRQAIAALDRGECVVIFPEGALRRSDEKPLKRFGRGIWQILTARPDTPVFACWIEGAWGSFFSYSKGEPTRNKRLDFRRPIAVAVPASFAIDPAILANHLPTRMELMNRVLESRKILGLPELEASADEPG